MGCRGSASFVVLIDGSPLGFFDSSRSVKQGSPLSNFLFLLVTNSLSKLIVKAKREGFVEGIYVARSSIVTNFLFVDNI